jgi:BMFP domain-containing protein YqiC
MNKEKKINSLFTLASGIINGLEGAKIQSKERVKAKVNNMIEKYNLVTEKEFNELKEMTIKARQENDRLLKKVSALEKKIKNM